MLPIWQLHSVILRHLMEGNQLVLVAATGSGKTTQVPQMLLDGGVAGDKRIVILQPRRVAARSVATRVAWERRSPLGTEVGYQVRFEDHLSDSSRLCFVTEGILLRWLQSDQLLSDIGVVIFDEFHERNLLSDVALALVKRLQQTTRPDLKIVVMSATLEAQPVAAYLGVGKPAPVLVSEGRTFPVSIQWGPYGDRRPAPERALDAILSILQNDEPGDILVFMPGMAEINATLNALRSARLPCRLLPLHGELPPEEQDRAFAPCDQRKIVVATNVAETSVTIDGILHVVDSGLARVARYDAERGIQTVGLEDISRASAEQRCGRAGRTAPGTCWRLWTESHHLTRPPKNTPEIQRADLAETVLLLHSLGIQRAADFDWLDQPDKDAIVRAESLLEILGALTEAALTPVGQQMLRLPMHPRYSRMLVEASRRGCVPQAALCAALVSGRDLLTRLPREDSRQARFEDNAQSDFYTLIAAQQFARDCQFDLNACQRAGIHAQTARQVEDTFRQFLQIARRERLFEDAAPQPPPDALGKCLLAGFIDQLAIRSQDSQSLKVAKSQNPASLECQLTEGRTGTLVKESVVQAPLMVVASLREVDARGGRLTLLSLASAIHPDWLHEIFPQHLTSSLEHVFDRTHKRVAAIRQERCLGLVIAQKHQRETEPSASGKTLAQAFTDGCFDLPNLDHEARQFIHRLHLICSALPELEFPPLTPEAMRVALARAFKGLTLVKEAQSIDLRPHLRRHLAPEQLQWLDELFPLSIPWHDGKKLKLTYPDQEPPFAQVKLNDTWPLKTHPSLGEGKVPVLLWLLLPDGKRLDSTTDFPAWKASAYPKLRNSIRSKYPGFAWP